MCVLNFLNFFMTYLANSRTLWTKFFLLKDVFLNFSDGSDF